MPTETVFVAELEKAAQGQGTLSVERVQRSGSPSVWDERISLSAAGEQKYETVRSAVDEGGSPIGRWWSGVPSTHFKEVAQALLASRMWSHASEQVSPGQELIEWRCAVRGAVASLVVAGGSPLLFSFSDLESVLRGMATDLMDAHHGCELVCELALEKKGRGLEAALSFRNDGDHDALIASPWRETPGFDDYLRLEWGYLPREVPGVTSEGITYEPLTLARPPELPAPWTDAFVLIPAKSSLALPVTLSVESPAGAPFSLRAVYSAYGAERDYAGLPVLRGRAFSKDVELGVL